MAAPDGPEPALLGADGAIPTAPLASAGPLAPTALQSGGALPGSALAPAARVLNPVTARLVVDVFSRHGPLSGARVTAGVVSGQAPFELPVSAQGNRFTIDVPLGEHVVAVSVADLQGRLFGEEVSYAVSASGLSQLRATANVTLAGESSGAPSGSSSPEQRVSVFLSRVRDVTAEAERVLGGWALPAKTVEVLDDPPSAVPHFSPRAAVAPPVRILELAGVKRPQLVALCWPAGLDPGAPGKFLVFLHHRIEQNLGGKRNLFKRDGQRYPWGRDFLDFGFMHYLDYAGSPLDGLAGGKGLAYQLGASGKPVALVLPMPHFAPEDSAAGELRKADTLEDVLLEIAAHKAHEAGLEPSKQLERVALASFSSGISDQIEMLQKGSGHGFYRNALRELYLFEGTEDAAYREQALRWAADDPNGDKAIRIYRQLDWSPDRRRIYTEKGFQLWPATGRRTFAALTPQVWRAVPAKVGPFFEAEADIVNTMLVDALRRSGF